MFLYGPMVISVSSFDAGIAAVYATVRSRDAPEQNAIPVGTRIFWN